MWCIPSRSVTRRYLGRYTWRFHANEIQVQSNRHFPTRSPHLWRSSSLLQVSFPAADACKVSGTYSTAIKIHVLFCWQKGRKEYPRRTSKPKFLKDWWFSFHLIFPISNWIVVILITKGSEHVESKHRYLTYLTYLQSNPTCKWST